MKQVAERRPPVGMTYFNPISGSLIPGATAQRVAGDDKERQIARSQALSKNSAAEGDRFEHQVESADALSPVGDDAGRGGHSQQQQQRRPRQQAAESQNDDAPRLDVKG